MFRIDLNVRMFLWYCNVRFIVLRYCAELSLMTSSAVLIILSVEWCAYFC